MGSDFKLCDYDGVSKYLSPGVRLVFLDSVTSTNTLLKKAAEDGEDEGLLLVALSQTAGRGSKGRSFLSRYGEGVYFSLLLRPRLKPSDNLLITTLAAVAVSLSIEKNTSKETKIKWVNDVYVGQKKVAGILTESSFLGDNINYAILGIGINMILNEDALPAELKSKAGSVFNSFSEIDNLPAKIVADCVNIFLEKYKTLPQKDFLSDYRTRSYLDGKRVRFLKNGMEREGLVLGVDEDFSLKIDSEGEILNLTAGETVVM